MNKKLLKIIFIIVIISGGYYSNITAQYKYLNENYSRTEKQNYLFKHQFNEPEVEETVYMFDKGFKICLGFGYCFDPGSKDDNRLKLDLICSYQFNHFISLGAGVGDRYYMRNEVQILPVYLSFNANTQGQSPKYFALNLGASTENDVIFKYPGVYVSVGFGFYQRLTDILSVKIGASFEHTTIHRNYMSYGTYYSVGKWISENVSVHSACIDVGFTFH